MLSIVVPTYKRAGLLDEVNTRLVTWLEGLPEPYEIIWVDDASNDGTDKVLDQMCSSHEHVHALILALNAGQQNASLAGLRHSKGDRVITLDDDLRYGVDSIGLLLEESKAGYDVVYGLPPRQDNGRFRHIGTDVKEAMFTLLCKKPKNVTLTSCRLISRKVCNWICEDQVSKVYISARLLQMTGNIGMVEVHSDDQMDVSSNYTVAKLFEVFWQVFKNYSVLGRIMGIPKRGQQYTIKEIYH